MTAANPEQSIFLAALELPTPAERAAYLKGACGPDLALMANVQELLAAHEAGDDFLDRPPRNATVDEQPVAERPGTAIGPYKLLQQIGEGGMGVVYMAEQQEPIRRRVALKIIKPGMDSAQVIARFEAERQALALMDHQNIAKVFDAGTTESGRPYFVMELVHGVPITQYCDDNQLTPKERLELFLSVCHAVQHAHQKGIIHRDLKPSNVLVCLYDGVAVPKVIDFGIAKATGQQLTERTMFTQFGTLVGTLEYMSPEQAEMSQLGIDTRSDVYALGVLLYELLTGTTPLERHRLREAGFDEIRRLIREEEPPRPSTRLSTSGVALAAISAQRQTEPAKLTRLVRGELDWIVMKALEKDRNRRYETANSLAREVERYLHDEPVEACPPATGYKLRKFARKHKKGLATAVGFAALLVLGTTISAWQAVRAAQAETVAEANEHRANAHAAQAEQKEQEAKNERDQIRALNEKLRATQDELRSTLYAAHINLAQHTWDAGGFGRVVELLERHRLKPGERDLRGFEWYYLDRLCRSDLFTLKGHTGAVYNVAYSSDGKRLLSASHTWDKNRDWMVNVWDTETGHKQRTISSKDFGEGTVFSPDGTRVASHGVNSYGTVKVWDTQSGQELSTLKGVGGDLVFSPDNERLAGTDHATVKVWDAQTGQELRVIQGGRSPVAFSADGKRLVSGSGDGALKVWNAQNGQELLSIKAPGTSGRTVAFSPDGTRVASASNDHKVNVWDSQTGQQLLAIQAHAWFVSSVAFSPDGKRLASASGDKMVKVWDAQTGQQLLTITGHSGVVWRVAFSPDGKHLASSSADKTVKIWDAQTGQKPMRLKAGTSSVASVAFSPDGKRLASAGGDAVKVWDALTGKEMLSFKGFRCRSVAFSPDGKRLVSNGPRVGTVNVWDAQTGQELLILEHAGFSGGWRNCVVLSPDGKRLACSDGTVKVWDAQTGQELPTIRAISQTVGPHGVNSMAFSPDGKRLAAATWNGVVKVWDTQTGQELLTREGHPANVVAYPVPSGLAFDPGGKRLASVSLDNTVNVRDAETGDELLALRGHTGGITSVAFSPDGKRLVSASFDNTVKLWDAQTGQELLSLKGLTGEINSVAFSPDGHRLVAGSENGIVAIWDATPLPEKP